MRRRIGCLAVTVVLIGGLAAETARANGYLSWGMGRNDYSNRYDTPTNYWPTNDATGGAAGLVYRFGQFELTSLPPGVSPAMALQGIQAAAAAWEPWLNIDIDSTGTIAGGSNTGFVRIRYDNTTATGAYALPYNWGGGGSTFGEIVFGTQTGSASAWNQTNFNWTMIHEFGHILGLRDLYNDFAGAPLAEDFVDHPVAGNPNPQRDGQSLRDNVMFQYNYAGNNYTQNPQTIVDNDEIFGGTWLWGGPYNQIVTGDMTYAGGGRNVVDVDFAHGDQAGNVLGWWDYRVSFKAGGGDKPYVDLEFPGYETFLFQALGATTPGVTHTDLGNDIHRFEVQEAGWVGNLILEVKSEYTAERRVRAWVTGGGQTDNFVLPINLSGRAQTGNNWAVVFGPQGPSADMDFGDLPDSYRTLLASDGPRYDSLGLILGQNWDTEVDGQPTPFADGDDANLWSDPGPDDEDGVLFGPNDVTIVINNGLGAGTDAHLDAWWDLNDNGFFDHATEHIIDLILTNLPVGDTVVFVNSLGFDPTQYASRFRLTHIDGTGVTVATDVLPWGEYINFGGVRTGEVEDYPSVPTPAGLAGGLVLLAMAGGRRRVQ